MSKTGFLKVSDSGLISVELSSSNSILATEIYSRSFCPGRKDKLLDEASCVCIKFYLYD